MAKFDYAGQLNGADNPVTIDVLISQAGGAKTATVGGVVVLDALSDGGGCEAASAGSLVLGICVGLYQGIRPIENLPAGSYSGTYVASTRTYTAASDNITVDKIYAKVVVDPMAKWKNDSAGDLVAADLFKCFDLVSATQVANQNGHDTQGAFQLLEIDPNDASTGIFRIRESEFGYAAQQA
jgi:hypothetical protein